MKRLKRPDLALLRREKKAATNWDKDRKQKAGAKRAILVDDVDLLRQMQDDVDLLRSKRGLEPHRRMDSAMLPDCLKREGCK